MTSSRSYYIAVVFGGVVASLLLAAGWFLSTEIATTPTDAYAVGVMVMAVIWKSPKVLVPLLERVLA